MKLICAVVLGLACALSAHAGQTLKTPSFDVTIEARCGEGVVGCDNVRYIGVHRASGRAITLVGRERHSRCADGVTPCRFLGYEFRNGKTVYFVDADGHLSVREGERTLLQEAGTWQ